MKKPMNTYLVYLKEAYVRDAQGCLRGSAHQTDNETHWQDISGPVLLMQIATRHPEYIWSKIAICYPDADLNIFEVKKASGTLKDVEKPERRQC